MNENLKKVGTDLTDEELMEITGGETFVTPTPAVDSQVILKPEMIIQPLYGIKPVLKYGVQPLYGVMPIQPLYGIKPTGM